MSLFVCCFADRSKYRHRFIEPVKRNGPIFKVVDLPRVGKRTRSKRAVDASCNTQITPSCLQQLYNIPTTAASASGNSLGVSGFIDEIPNKADLSVSPGSSGNMSNLADVLFFIRNSCPFFVLMLLRGHSILLASTVASPTRTLRGLWKL